MVLVSFLTSLSKRQLSFQGLTTAFAITYSLLRALQHANAALGRAGPAQPGGWRVT